FISIGTIPKMETENHTMVTEFIILGLTEDPTLCSIFFVVFLGIYVTTVLGNLSIIMLIQRSPQLHTPMYLFLSHLAFVDMGYSSSVTPIMIVSLLRKRTAIPVAGCIAQLGSDVVFGTAECFLLAAMAYDRYVAICSPLLYSTLMSSRVCYILTSYFLSGGCVNVWTFTSCLLSLSVCGLNQIDTFSVTYFLGGNFLFRCPIIEMIPSVSSGSTTVATMVVIVLPCCQKLFSAYIFHFIVITLYYRIVTSLCVLPKTNYQANQNRVVSLIYAVGIPMLNTSSTDWLKSL
uniref:G-protein coupled receptors family 1 profile domain-containing protein n=1 Tax=Cavia porcellus TaxID=10141 RepID=H0VXV6_CAVPO